MISEGLCDTESSLGFRRSFLLVNRLVTVLDFETLTLMYNL